jgi:predicted  nucleic acid-binding Zn-ribbon protein
MPLWGEVLKQAVRLLPELHRLLPLLDRIASPEAREEQRKRTLATAAAAQQAHEAAESTRQSVLEATRRLASQHADLVARIDSCEQRIKDASHDLRAVAEAQAASIAKLNSAIVWIKTSAVLALIMIGLLIVVLLKR